MFKEQKYYIETSRKPSPDSLLIVFSKNGQKTIVIARIDLKKGDEKYIYDALKAKLQFNCIKALIIVNGKFTKKAQKLARIKQLDIWDDKKILKKLLPIHNNSSALKLPGTNDLENALREIGSSLGIHSDNIDK